MDRVGSAVDTHDVECSTHSTGLCHAHVTAIGGEQPFPSPRLQGEDRRRNIETASVFLEMAAEKGVAPGTLAIAWLLSRGEDIDRSSGSIAGRGSRTLWPLSTSSLQRRRRSQQRPRRRRRAPRGGRGVP
jgi:hypothetical protein